jgi:hypothetical protein
MVALHARRSDREFGHQHRVVAQVFVLNVLLSSGRAVSRPADASPRDASATS